MGVDDEASVACPPR